MKFYIYIDENDKEIRREEKGRGKTRSGAVKKDGNFYIKEFSATKSTKTDPEKAKQAEASSYTETENKEEFKTRELNNKGTTTLSKILDRSVVFSSPIDRHIDEKTVNMYRVALTGDLGINDPERICNTACYARLEVDLSNGDLKLWSTYPNGLPTYVYKGAVTIGSSN